MTTSNISENLKFPRAKSRQPNFAGMSYDEQYEWQVNANEHERYALAVSPYAHSGILHILGCQDPSEHVRIGVAHNHETSHVTLHRMAMERRSEELQYAVAINRNTQANTLFSLGGRGRPDAVRLAVAEHPNCPEELARSIWQEVRGAGW